MQTKFKRSLMQTGRITTETNIRKILKMGTSNKMVVRRSRTVIRDIGIPQISQIEKLLVMKMESKRRISTISSLKEKA